VPETPENKPPDAQTPSPLPTDALALGETPLEGGFRRVSKAPEPLALTRLRELLLDVAAGSGDGLREALEGFRSWSSLASLCGTEWIAGARRSSMAARRVLQRRLRVLGARPVTVAQAAELPIGSAVHVRGLIRAAASPAGSEGGPKSHIWFHSTTYTDNVRVVVEQGHDFFLTCEVGGDRAATRVVVARGHLVNAEELEEGHRVSVFGFTDRMAGRGAARRDPMDRGATGLCVRSGDDLPLIVRWLGGPPTQER
jgi:hypothetical protein